MQRVALAEKHYGYRRIAIDLGRAGFAVNHKRVLRLMREDNLLCLRRRAFVPATTDSNHGWQVVPNLTRGIILTGLDQLWVADITYIRMQEEFSYLAIVLDAFSRRVVGWALETHLQASLAIAANDHDNQLGGPRRSDKPPMRRAANLRTNGYQRELRAGSPGIFCGYAETRSDPRS